MASKKALKSTLEELHISRDGGQNALIGYTYQFLYSCVLILSEMNSNTLFRVEGIEDIDKIVYTDSSEVITHVQLKYSTQRQDASFLKSVLENYLEVYLLDVNRVFKLVYDFEVSDGNLRKLFENDLDKKSLNYWNKIVADIKEENPLWRWDDFSFDDFMSKLDFERKAKSELSQEIEKLLDKTYGIMLSNVSLFANGLKVCCLEKMECRESICKNELDTLILRIGDDISKGKHNPAHGWIKRIDFSTVTKKSDLSYYEGKKPIPQDIAQGLPIRRLQLEKDIIESIQDNRVTVIKASSGQGKTTLALRTAYELQNEYIIYQLLWCNDQKELKNISEYFVTRVKLGEKPLIVIDNLDSKLSEWNKLAQLLQEEVVYHYKLLVTTREDDWYSFSGDLSDLRSVKIIKPNLSEEEAENIFHKLKHTQQLHYNSLDWRKAWAAVSNKKLLIEYVYLLTHGEMLSSKIVHQIQQINSTETGRIKCELLRKICFADICGIRLSTGSLIANLSESSSRDSGEVLKSLENEFLIRIDSAEKYVEGLHPVRSQHIVDALHDFIALDETALQVVQIANPIYYPKLFSSFPRMVFVRNEFYSKLVNLLCNSDDLSALDSALQGVFSGTVMQYYKANQHAFEDANEHGGLFLFDMELTPFTKFEELAVSVKTLDELHRIMPDNTNLQYLCELRDNTPKIDLSKTDIYLLCSALYEKLKGKEMFSVTSDVVSYSSIIFWLINIEPSFNLSKNVRLEKVWQNSIRYPVSILASIMYTSFCGNRDVFVNFVSEHLLQITKYLRDQTKSLRVYVLESQNEIHVEYVLLPSDIRKANDESVSRLELICKMLPIFDRYCADAVSPKLSLLSEYPIPDDAHKSMPIRNLVITFHKQFASLWSKTILSNFECSSILEWLEHWFMTRKIIVDWTQKSILCIYKLLQKKKLGSLANDIVNSGSLALKSLIREHKYPFEERPFDEKAKIPPNFSKSKGEYFGAIQNSILQFAGFMSKNEKESRLLLINMRRAVSSVDQMQNVFTDICDEQGLLSQQNRVLCEEERESLHGFMSALLYFNEHHPSEYFSKYDVKEWCTEEYRNKMARTAETLKKLSSEYSVVFPNQFYYEEILSYLPIIISDFTLTDENEMSKLLLLCLPFAELDYDFLVLVFCNEHGKITENGLGISKRLFEGILASLNNDDALLPDGLSSPLPMEITSKILNCFESVYHIERPNMENLDGVDRVGELLWALSKYQEALSLNEAKDEFFEQVCDNHKKEIILLLKRLEPQLSKRYFEEIKVICDSVFDGAIYSDESLNSFCSRQRSVL